MIKAVENHHSDRTQLPEFTIPLELHEHQKLHGNVCIDTLLSRLVRQYDIVTRQIVRVSNWSKAWQKQFCSDSLIAKQELELLMIEKNRLHKEVVIAISVQLKEFRHLKNIRGIGPITLAYILAFVNPTKYSSQRAFLYCAGFAGATRTKGHSNFNHRIRAVMHTAAGIVISNGKKTNNAWYQLYVNVKQQMKAAGKSHPDGRAKNRLATFLLKEIYATFRSDVEK